MPRNFTEIELNKAVLHERQLYLRRLVRNKVQAQVRKEIIAGDIEGLTIGDLNFGKGKSGNRFVTICPPETRQNQQFTIDFTKWVSEREWLHGSRYVYEQRKVDPFESWQPKNGLHVHMIIPMGKPPSEIQREIMKKFDIKDKRNVQIKPCVDVDGALRYMSGQKDDPEKMKKAACDFWMRKFWNLQVLYTIA